MLTKALLSVKDYSDLDEPVGVRYELSDGELIVSPSATPFHNKIRDRFNIRLQTFPGIEKLGDVFSETGMKLVGEVVRRPDVAFIRAGRLEDVNLDQVPLPIAPDLVIEAVSKDDRADDLMLKVSQYLQAGARAVWLLYPKARFAYRYTPGRREPEVRAVETGDKFEEPELLPGFSLALGEILE